MKRGVAEKKIKTIPIIQPDDFFNQSVKDTFLYLCDHVNLASTQKELLLMQSL